jgi:hypothetical protein
MSDRATTEIESPAVSGISSRACDVPEGWHAIAEENSRNLKEMLLPGNLLIKPRYHVIEIDTL